MMKKKTQDILFTALSNGGITNVLVDWDGQRVSNIVAYIGEDESELPTGTDQSIHDLLQNISDRKCTIEFEVATRLVHFDTKN